MTDLLTEQIQMVSTDTVAAGAFVSSGQLRALAFAPANVSLADLAKFDRADSNEFRSIYPRFYVERAIHIHFKVHVGNRAFLTNQALLPEPDNAAVLAMPAYSMPRKGKRITNAQEADWGLQTMKLIERQQKRLAVLDLVLPVS